MIEFEKTSNTSYIKHLLHETVLHQTPLTRNNFYTKYLLDQTTF